MHRAKRLLDIHIQPAKQVSTSGNWRSMEVHVPRPLVMTNMLTVPQSTVFPL
jgi:hypothetical protein